MNLVRWKRFSWDLQKAPPPPAAALHSFLIRPALKEDERAMRDAVLTALAQDNAFGGAQKHLRSTLEGEIEEAFEQSPIPAVVVKHGQRIIAAALLSTDLDAENHLLSGPCVLSEYRNRGIGTALLLESLRLLHGAGLSIVHGVCDASSPAAKFVYRKFGSTSDVFGAEPSVAAH